MNGLFKAKVNGLFKAKVNGLFKATQRVGNTSRESPVGLFRERLLSCFSTAKKKGNTYSILSLKLQSLHQDNRDRWAHYGPQKDSARTIFLKEGHYTADLDVPPALHRSLLVMYDVSLNLT